MILAASRSLAAPASPQRKVDAEIIVETLQDVLEVDSVVLHNGTASARARSRRLMHLYQEKALRAIVLF